MRASIVVAVVALPLIAARVDAQSTESFTLSGDRVVVFNLAGNVRVEQGSGAAVVVEVTRAGDDASRLTVRTGDVDGWKSLRVVYPDDRIVYPRMGRGSTNFRVDRDGTFGGRALRATLTDDGFSIPGSGIDWTGSNVRISGSGSGLEAYADLRVLVPRGQVVTIALGVGRVDVSGVEGQVRVEAMSGSVTASAITGPTLLETGSGSVNATGVTGHLYVATGSGSVDVESVRNGALEVSTGSGSIDATDLHVRSADMETGSGTVRLDGVDAPKLTFKTGSGGIRASNVRGDDLTMRAGSGSITLGLLSDISNAHVESGSGSVTVTVPRELGAEIWVDTGSGGIDSDVAMSRTVQRRGSLRGTIGDGNGRLEIGTGSGGVHLLAR